MSDQFSHLSRILSLAIFFALPVQASTVNAIWNSPGDTPVVASSYTASGSTVNLTLNFAPLTGTNLMVVNNTGLPFTNGAFSNLAQGQAVALTFAGTTYNFVANYFGGSGNDLVLQWAATRLFAWGNNDSGQLGNNRTKNSAVPVAVAASDALSGKTVTRVSSAYHRSVALCSDGTLVSWGQNYSGELGINSTVESHVPVPVNRDVGVSALYGKTPVAIAAGGYFSLALCSDGTVVSWGDNYYGQLGNNSSLDSYVPVPVNTGAGVSALSGKNVVSIAAGYAHALALCSDGTVVAWGLNSDGQLGNNGIGQSSVPVAVNTTSGVSALSGKSVIAISAGGSHNLALCSDGAVVAWGDNYYGQLGFGSFTVSSTVPVTVSTTGALSGRTVVAVAAGYDHSLALCSNGAVVAWGHDRYGELGSASVNPNGQFNYSTIPVDVNTAAGVSALSGQTPIDIGAGDGHSLARCANGTVVEWGAGYYGQLGNNASANSNVPVAGTLTGLASGERMIGTWIGATSSHGFGIAGVLTATGSGSISATLTPAGAQWNLDGGGWQNSGATLSAIPAGSHVVSFKDVIGYFTPADQTVVIQAGQATPIVVSYVADAPLIVVEQPAGAPLSYGAANVDFGSVFPGNSVVRQFTIWNTGTHDLTGLGITQDGTDSADFTVVKSPSAPVSPGGSTTFAVEFTPKATGARSAAIHISSNDFTHSPFNVALIGDGAAGISLLNNWQWRNPLTQGNDLNGMTYANGLFVAVGAAATIMTSPDGVTWTQRMSPFYADLWDVTYGNGMFMAVGERGAILTSTDGVNWTHHPTASDPYLSGADIHGVAFGNGRFVVVNGDATDLDSSIRSTPDGVTWSGGYLNNPNGYWWRIAFGNGVFVAVGDGGAVATSTDGIVFTARGTGAPSFPFLDGITFGNGVFVAVGTATTGGNTSVSVTSSDGIHWTSHSIPTIDFVNGLVSGIAFGNGKFVTVGDEYPNSPRQLFLTSPDGATWTKQENVGDPAYGGINGIAYGAGVFAATGRSGRILTSTDAMSWVPRTSAATIGWLKALGAGNSAIVAVGISGQIVTTSNGASWALQASGTTNDLNDISNANGTFVVVGDSGTILTSANGYTWTGQTSGTVGDLNGITYANGLFVAVGESGRVRTSTNNGLSWTGRTSNVTSVLQSVTYGAGTFVAVGGNRIITSTDAVNWTVRSTTAPATKSVAYSNGLFVAVGNSALQTSPDGTNWTSQTVPTNGGLEGVSAANGMFIAVGDPITPSLTSKLAAPSAILTSPDGVNWTSRTSPTRNSLFDAIYANGLLVSVGAGGTILTSGNWIADPAVIAVEQPAGAALTSGGIPLNFGPVLADTASSKSFVIRNSGASNLTLGTITPGGSNAGDFSVTTPPTSPVTPGSATTFTVTFTPGAIGSRSATLTIPSNDPATASFVVNVSGTGSLAASGAATLVTSGWATFNGTVNPNGKAATALFQYGTTAGYGASTLASNVGSGTSSVPVSFNAFALTPGTTYHYRTVMTNADGTFYGADQTFTTPVSSPPAWHYVRLSLTGNAALGGKHTAQPSTAYSYFHYYKGTDNKIWALWYGGGAWNQAPLTSIANVDDWFTENTTYNQLYYKGTDNHIYALWFGAGAWNQLALTTNPNVLGELQTDSGTNFTYYRGSDNNLWVLWYGAGKWNQAPLTSSAKVAGDVVVDSKYHFAYYRGTDSQMWVVWFGGGKWNEAQLSTTANVAGDLLVDPGWGTYYKDGTNTTWAVWFTGVQWAQTNLGVSTGVTNGPSSLYGHLGVIYTGMDGAAHYLGNNGSQWSISTLGSSGMNLDGPLNFKAKEGFIYGRTTDGHLGVFYYQ